MALVRRGAWWILLALVAGVLIGGGVIAYAGTHTYSGEFGLFTHSAEPSGIDDGITVVVSTVDIPAGASFDPLIDQGTFQVVLVPNNVFVSGAVTDIVQLTGKHASAPIYTNEQIPVARIAD